MPMSFGTFAQQVVDKLNESSALAAAHREGVIEGLERALHLRQYGVIEADHIRDEIERHCRREGGLTVDEYERIQQRDGREEIIRLRAEVEKLRRVRDAVRLFLSEADSDERGNLWAGRETVSKLCAAWRDGAALDAAKGG